MDFKLMKHQLLPYKTKTLAALILLAGLTSCATQGDKTAANTLQRELDVSDQKQKLGYAAGFQHAKTLLSINSPFDRDAFTLGVQDALSNQTPKLEKAELEQVDSQQLGQLNLEAVKQIMLKQGRSFLAHNKTEPDVKTLASGLQYKIANPGRGKQPPKATDTVNILYRFSRLDGSDLTKDALPGKSIRKSPVSRLPKGLQEAITMMVEGAQWRLYLPPDLMNGEYGALASGILPNETVLCDLELDSIEPVK
jgi:FKBP-type peptidyl-prolyl cis-trans isomerase